ncbi:MFS transporter [Salibacterium halotolerans]|uniref:Sugar phosphate permease n=1 Tax=Salibacterium halotolerans TaxID=1884432 RepID=A0A1I5SS97_9BACI|nr:MFS transporter [Salibacterium halotolerans]SFP73650.1 Sugar phosphate permease [Salibacterium halotolerans]
MNHSSTKTVKRLRKDNLPVQPPFFYGWLIVAIAALGAFFSGPGQTYSISVFMDIYIEEFEGNRTMISSIYSASTLAAGLLLFLTGRLIDKKGQRYTTVLVGTMLAIACFWNSAMIGPVMMFIGFFMLRLFGQGSMTLVPNTLVPQWFSKQRGRAFSFMTLGVLASGAAMPPIHFFLIELGGWRFTWVFWGTVLLVVFVPAAFVFIRNRPEDVGLLPDNDGKDGNREEAAAASAKERRESSWTVYSAVRTKSFWFALFCAVVPSLVNTGITIHLFSILGEKGIERPVVAFLLSLMPITAFLFTLAAGFVVERVKLHIVYSLGFLLSCFTFILLIYAQSAWSIVLFVVLWGFFDGTTKICNNMVWPEYFGLDHIGKLKSFATTAIVIGSALGPLPFGIAFDYFGQYNEILWMMIALPVLAAILAFASPPPQKKSSPDM